MRFDKILSIGLFVLLVLSFVPQNICRSQGIAQRARAKINEKCLSDVDLHGSVILLDDGLPGATLVVASNKADEQTAKLEALHSSLNLGQVYPIIGTVKLPHEEWLADAREILRDASRDSGDLIQSLYYQDVGGGLEMTLQGRLSCSLGYMSYDKQLESLKKWGDGIDQNPAFAEQNLIKRYSFLYQHKAEKLGGLLSKEQSWNFLVGNETSGNFLTGLRMFNKKFVNTPQLYGGFAQAIENLDPTGESIIGIDLYVWPNQKSPDQSSYAQSELQRIFPNLPVNLVEQQGGNWSSVLDEIEQITRSSSKLDGCEVNSFCFSPQWDEINNSNRLDGFDVFPVGRMGHRQQWPHLDQLIKTQLLESSENRELIRLIGITPNNLRASIAIPVDISAFEYPTNNPLNGQLNFVEGLSHFNKCFFEKAAACFKEASLNDPLKVEYRYWHALSELKQGKSDQAYAIILASVRRFGLSSPRQRRKIARSIARIQGPIRSELQRLEMKAIREVKTYN